MTKKIRLLQITGIALLAIQIFKYIKTDFEPPYAMEKYNYLFAYTGYAIGYNIYLIGAVILFSAGYMFKKRVKL